MNKYLFTTLISNDLGLLTRSLPIAHELNRRGHEVAFCNPAISPVKLINEAGFINLFPEWPLYYIISGDIKSGFKKLITSRHILRNLKILFSSINHINKNSTAEFWNIDHFYWYMGMWDENFVRADVTAMVDVIKKFDPDVVVDFWNVSACIAARICRKPLITIIQSDMHPQSKGFIWWKEPPAHLPSPVEALNKILIENGLPEMDKTGDLFIGDMTLVLGIPETDPLPETANVTYIGPVLWEKPNQKLPDWVENFKKDKPLIWIYPGNPQYGRGANVSTDSAVVTRACVEALKNQDLQVVLSTGHQPVPKENLPLPANFRQVDFLPGLMMAQRSDLLIHHGGYGSCQTGLYTGTPSVIIPTYSERESNARRVASVGAGEFIVPVANSAGKNKKIDPSGLKATIDLVLADKSYQRKAENISMKLKKYGGATEAANQIEKFSSG